MSCCRTLSVSAAPTAASYSARSDFDSNRACIRPPGGCRTYVRQTPEMKSAKERGQKNAMCSDEWGQVRQAEPVSILSARCVVAKTGWLLGVERRQYRGGCDSLAAGPFAGAAAEAPICCRIHTPLGAPSRTTLRETESGEHWQATGQRRRLFWPQPEGTGHPATALAVACPWPANAPQARSARVRGAFRCREPLQYSRYCGELCS